MLIFCLNLKLEHNLLIYFESKCYQLFLIPKFQQNIARNACTEFKIIKRIFDIENQILVIFDPTLTSRRKLNQKSVFCGITSYGKNLHLVPCATVCSKNEVMLLKGSKLRNRFPGCVTEIRILTLLLKTLPPNSL